jgi:hypothetical protein
VKRFVSISLIVSVLALAVIAMGGLSAASALSKASAGGGKKASAARRRGLRGPRGFRGRRGLRGLRGLTGPPGPVGPPGPTTGTTIRQAGGGGVAPFNFGTTLNTGLQLYAAHGVSIQGQCTTGSSGQTLVMTATASEDNEALYAKIKYIDSNKSIPGDANFDAGESIFLINSNEHSAIVTVSYIGADGATFTLIFGEADDDADVDANGGSAGAPSDPALDGAGCLIWGTRQLG